MANIKWTEYCLTDLYSIRSGLSKPAKDFGEGYPFLSFKDVFYNYFLPDELTQLVRSNDKEREGCSIQRGDIFLTRTSETMEELGMSSVARKSYPDATFNGFCKRLRPSTDITIHPEFVGYFLRSPKFRNGMLAFSTMSTRASLNNDMISRLRITLPPLPEQKAIAHILKSLDDKIELNRRMNATLEGMAQALFKSWFVDFDPVIDNALAAGNPIPDEFAARAETRRKALADSTANRETAKNFPAVFQLTEEMGWIPEGWKIVRFNQVLEKYIDNRGKTPPLSSTGIPMIEVKHIADDSITPNLNTGKYVDESTYNTWFRNHLDTDDIVISTVGTIGRICMVTEGVNFVIAQNLLGLRFDKKKASPFYMYYQMKGFRFKHDVDARLVITVQASIKRKDLETIDFLSPAIEIQAAFEVAVKALMQKQTSRQKHVLTKLRDTLLPKLISGELRIDDAENMTKVGV